MSHVISKRELGQDDAEQRSTSFEITTLTMEPPQIKRGCHCSIKEAIQFLRYHITVEPVMFLYVFAVGLNWTTINALLYKKVCYVNYGRNSTVCAHLGNKSFSTEEDVVQTQTSHWFLYENICFTVPAIFSSNMYGVWTDRYGRKLPIIAPLIGQLAASLNLIVNSVYMDAPIFLLLIGTTVSAISGGFLTILMGVFSYLSDVSSVKNRTVRVAIVEAMIALSFAISGGTSGVLLRHTNFVIVFSIGIVILLLGLLISVFWVRNVPKSKALEYQNGIQEQPQTEATEQSKKICDLETIKGSVQCVVRRRTGHKRRHILIIMSCIFLGVFGASSDSVQFLYLKRHPLSWTQSMYGYFQGVNSAVSGICLIVAVPLLKKKAHMRDTSLVLLGLVSRMSRETLFGLSQVTWMVFLCPVVGFFGSLVITCYRSMLSCIVESKEQGKMYAVIASLEGASFLLGSVMYNDLYPATLKFWAGFCFIFGASVSLIPLTMITYVHMDLKTLGSYGELKEEVSSCKVGTELSQGHMDDFIISDSDAERKLLDFPGDEHIQESVSL